MNDDEIMLLKFKNVHLNTADYKMMINDGKWLIFEIGFQHFLLQLLY